MITAAMTRSSAPVPALGSTALDRLVTITPAELRAVPKPKRRSLDPGRADAGQPGRLFVASDEIYLPQIRQVPQEQIPGNHSNRQQQHGKPHPQQRAQAIFKSGRETPSAAPCSRPPRRSRGGCSSFLRW